MQILQLEKPEYQEVKKGGLLDSMHKGRFVEYLADIEYEKPDMSYEPRENQYPDCFTSRREQQTSNQSEKYDH